MSSNQVLSSPDASGSGLAIKKTVLIVDDDEDFRSCLAEGLETLVPGLTVHAAANGEQAVAIVRSIPVDLMITDLHMPAMDGRELVLWMKEYGLTTRIIVMSAYADPGTVSDLQEQGYYFFDKPAGLDALAGAVRSVIAQD